MHMLHRYQRNFEEYVRRHAGLILLLGGFFVIGVIFGGLAVRSIGDRDRTELVAYLGESMERIAHPAATDGRLILKQSLLRSTKELGFLWIAGISLVALPCTLVGALVLGFATGFTVSFLTAELGWGGLALAVAGHVPHSLIMIPALVIAGAAASSFSLQVIRSWRERRRLPQFYPTLARFTGAMLATGLALLLSGLIEAYISPSLARLAASLLHLS